MLHDLLITTASSIREAMATIEKNGLGVAFVTENERLVGVMTDGDIRRALLSNPNLDRPVSEAMNRSFVALAADATPEEMTMRLDGRISVIPLIDEENRPVEYVDRRRIPMAEPVFDGREIEYVLDCLKTGWISSQGTYIRRFEQEFAAYIGVKDAVAVTSGTTALHLALASFHIGRGDEVIVPDLTFASTANVVFHAGAKPVIVDVDPVTWNMDPEAVRKAITPRTKVIMPVHLYGQPCDMDSILSIAADHRLIVIEDAAEALGTEYHGRRAGSIGHAAGFSFFGNKLITTGEGGMITFTDPVAARRARFLRDHGMDPGKRYWHQEVGFNYRMTNLQAAVGVAQLERVDQLLAGKLRLAEAYRSGLAACGEKITFPAILPNTLNSYWSFSILIDGLTGEEERDALIQRLSAQGIDSRPFFYPMHEMPPYANFVAPGGCPVSRGLSYRGISLPSSTKISPDEIARICDALCRELA